MINRIKATLYTFVCVTTCIVFASALFTTIFWQGSDIGPEMLWQILIISALCSLGTMIYPDYEVTKRRAVCLTVLHYIIVNVVVLGGGILFGWFDADNLFMVLLMLLLIAVIYFLVSAIMWKRAENMASLMNEKLAEYRSRKK